MADLTQITIINIDDKASPSILAGLVGRNVSLLYQWAKDGRLPSITTGNFSYRQCIQHLVDAFISNEQVKIVKAEKEAELRREKLAKKTITSTDFKEEDNIHPLVAAKLRQNIKTEYAREAELWQKIAIKNEEYVEFTKKLSLVEPFILHIRDLLLGITLDFPETQETIDEGMEALYNLGIKLLEEVKIDRDEFVQNMLNKDVNTDE